MIKAVLLFASLLMLASGAARAAERASPNPACPQGVLTLRLLRPINDPPQPDVVAAWEAANPCTKIEVNEVPFGQLADKISVLAASGNPPDVLGCDGPSTASYAAAAGVLLPLDRYLPAGFQDDVTNASQGEHSYLGKLYWPGTQQTTLAMFYNARCSTSWTSTHRGT